VQCVASYFPGWHQYFRVPLSALIFDTAYGVTSIIITIIIIEEFIVRLLHRGPMCITRVTNSNQQRTNVKSKTKMCVFNRFLKPQNKKTARMLSGRAFYAA